MRNILIFFVALVLTSCASTDASNKNYKLEDFMSATSQELGHKITKPEFNITKVCYIRYFQKWEGAWTQARWKYALTICVKLNNNQEALSMADVGMFYDQFATKFIVPIEEQMKSP